MSQGTGVIFGISVLVAVFMLTRKVNAWRIKRAYFFVTVHGFRGSGFKAARNLGVVE